MGTYTPMAAQLETARLVLRPWSVDDVGWNHRLLCERDAPAPSVDDLRSRIVDQLARSARSGLALLVLQRRDDDEVLGYCGLILGRSNIDEPEIAYELFRHAHGKGYATEAAGAVVAAAAATGRTRLWATVRSWNAPSLRVLEKLAFTRDRVTTDDRGGLVWLTRMLRTP